VRGVPGKMPIGFDEFIAGKVQGKEVSRRNFIDIFPQSNGFIQPIVTLTKKQKVTDGYVV